WKSQLSTGDADVIPNEITRQRPHLVQLVPTLLNEIHERGWKQSSVVSAEGIPNETLFQLHAGASRMTRKATDVTAKPTNRAQTKRRQWPAKLSTFQLRCEQY